VASTTKYIFVTGGVLSGLGKGITAASIGNLLKARGLRVNMQKCDPYLNFDAGTLNPREHGECFVTKDGAETDLDLGHYERFLDEELTQSSSLMSGRILRQVIDDERAGKYDGQSVQIIPHVTGAIAQAIKQAGEGFDVHIVEIGGTVGDFEAQSFVEAIRELGLEVGPENCLYVHVVYMPFLEASKEIKTKPAQNAVRELRGLGITPDVLAARSERPAPKSVRRKLSQFCGVAENAIALLPNAPSIYQVPLRLEDDGVGQVIAEHLGFGEKPPKLDEWRNMVALATKDYEKTLHVGLVAKYLDNADAYMCVFEALRAAAWWNNRNVKIEWVDAEKLEDKTFRQDALEALDGIVVPGGFGSRGVEGKIQAADYALENNMPYLGLCLGMQVAVIAAARGSGLKDANSSEFDPNSKNPVISTMPGQEGKQNTGGTMRLGNYECHLTPGSLAAKLYGQKTILERHRHRYEANNDYRNQYKSWGIIPTGINPQNNLVEIVEAASHPFFVASQFHPEFTSRPNQPHPLFDGFIKACL
jgi:CTP synthase